MAAEQSLQIACVEWYNYQYPDQRLYSNYNNPRSKISGAIAKRMGLRAGVADLSLLTNGGRIVFIELKTAKGRQSSKQKDFQSLCDLIGAPYHLVRCLEEFIELINAYKS